MAIVAPRTHGAALITGASSGIGRELARQLARRGHDLILVARRLELLDELRRELRAEHGRHVDVVACDVSEPELLATDFAQIADMLHTEQRLPSALVATPADTAAAGLRALDRNRRVAVPGWGPRALNFTGGHAPRALWLRACRKLMA
jgi:short-subunit dehydrogenase